MCGIVGILTRQGAASQYSEIWPEFVNHLYHRGPDEGAFWSEGPFFLGSRRLSIIDLKTGSQPMGSEDGSLVVVHNGEIYNYIELREELRRLGCQFRTESDTEVLLHGYRVWGEELPARLTGMFAFAIVDRRAGSLFLARDRFGEKPLFWTANPQFVAFASEVRPLAALPAVRRELDAEGLGTFLSLNYVAGTHTLLRGIERVAPGGWRLFTVDGDKSGTYWSPPRAAIRETGSVDELRETLAYRLDHAVKLCLRSDVPVGIFLSGGLDSSAIAESAVRQGRISQAFVLDFEDRAFSEFHWAKTVADRLALPLERVVLTPKVLEEFLRMVDHADDPVADSSAIAVWEISKRASRTHKVVLTGDGGDEIFGGYMTYLATLLHSRITAAMPRPMRRAFSYLSNLLPTSEGKVTLSYRLGRFLRGLDLPWGMAHLFWNGTWRPEDAASLILPGAERDEAATALASLVSRLGLDGDCDLLRLQLADIAEYLPNDILVKVDRMSMAHGLETRAPLLSHELAEWVLRLPEPMRIDRLGRTKWLLRSLVQRHYGRPIASRAKQGFSIPIHQWVRGPLGTVIRDLLSPSSVKRLNILNAKRVNSLVDMHLSGRRSYGFELWGLAVLVAWHQLRIERPPAPPPSHLLRRISLG